MTEPARLLAGRRKMSRPEKEAVLDHVLARVAPRAWWRRPLVVGGFAAAALAAGVLVVLPARPPRDELTARGGERDPGFEVTCLPAPCTAGAKLVFDVSPGTTPGGEVYFAALGRRGDRVIWYFPSAADRRSVPVPPGGGVLDTGFAIGPEHAAGTYVIDGVFSAAPLDRAAIRAIVERGGATATRELTVR